MYANWANGDNYRLAVIKYMSVSQKSTKFLISAIQQFLYLAAYMCPVFGVN